MKVEDYLQNISKEKFVEMNEITKRYFNLLIDGVLASDDIRIFRYSTKYGDLDILKYYTEESLNLEKCIFNRITDLNDLDSWSLLPIMEYTVILVESDKLEYLGVKKGSYKKYLNILIKSLKRVKKKSILSIENPLDRFNKLYIELINLLPKGVYLPIEMLRIIQNDEEEISETFMDILTEKLEFIVFM